MIWKPTTQHDRTKGRFRNALHAAVRFLGWLLPETEAQVQAASNEEDENASRELPGGLKNPFNSLERRYESDRDNVA